MNLIPQRAREEGLTCSPWNFGSSNNPLYSRWVTLAVVWFFTFLYTLQHLKLRRGWKFTVPIADLSYRQMAREDERDNFLGSFLF